MAKITIKQGESLDVALKRFKKKVQQEGIMQEMRKREYYLKPGIRRRLKHEEALKARRKQNKRK